MAGPNRRTLGLLARGQYGNGAQEAAGGPEAVGAGANGSQGSHAAELGAEGVEERHTFA